VVGAARGERKLAAVRAQGAVAAIDYSGRDWPGRVPAALGGDRPAVVLDGVGGDIGRAAFAITAGGGVCARAGGRGLGRAGHRALITHCTESWA
jgi:NADPH2:quinone reductase